jgi:hypothetical protein
MIALEAYFKVQTASLDEMFIRFNLATQIRRNIIL